MSNTSITSLQALKLTCLLILFVGGCTDDPATPLFDRLEAERTGISFENRVEGDSTFNILKYPYFYDGGGVAAGDVNRDGLIDLYFTASEGRNTLYMNQGNLRFVDVTEQAGVGGSADWSKGVTMADVNGDGLLDIYVSNVEALTRQGRNELFINNGDGTFSERAEEYGLDFRGYATQASFFDYDLDGDLDAYLVNHSLHAEGTYGPDTLRYERHPYSGDRLLRNDGGKFVDVSVEAGIYGGRIGYGLAAVVSDLDVDGCPDIYVSNDFHEQDYLYFNNCDGTFDETIEESTGHTSRSSMGSDAGDVDGDGLPDLVVLDMLPARQDILNSSANFEPLALHQLKLRLGYHYQVIRNTLQWNRGSRRFSDVGYLAGVFATDWSWAALLADFDNDGRQDLFVTNGIYRRPNDRDFSNSISNPPMMPGLGVSTGPSDQELIESMPSVPLPNYAFRNAGGLTFDDVTESWGLGRPGFSNGAVYADLDNDGDLDLVVNNVNETAWIFENRSSGRGHHYLEVNLRGEQQNPYGIGARVVVKTGHGTQIREMIPTRGWQSSVPARLHFGLGDASRIDTLEIVWPDGRLQVRADLPVDTLLVLHQREAVDRRMTRGEVQMSQGAVGPRLPVDPLFIERTDDIDLPFRHRENTFVDFSREGLMPHKVSVEGPALAIGDVNNDGLDDIFAGGAKWQPAALLVQNTDGSFTRTNQPLWTADSLFEDVDAAFFDADGDGDLDLYVVSAGNEFSGENPALQDRLYINDGQGFFTRSFDGLPPMHTNGCCVATSDFDSDGDVDLFIGGRVVSRRYGETPRSFLLENDGNGTFLDVTERLAPGLSNVGMVTAASWGDVDGDGRPDLVVAGEWLTPTVFTQDGNSFLNRTAEHGLDGFEGLWASLVMRDLDGDGDTDLIAGNLGLNSLLRATPETPLTLTIGDVDADGGWDHFLTTTRLGEEYLLASPDELLLQLPSLTRRYRSYRDFGRISLESLRRSALIDSFLTFEARTLASVFGEKIGANNRQGTFSIREMPIEAQIAPVHAIVVTDVNGDERLDVIMAGNSHRPRILEGRYDAGYGIVLLQRRDRSFETASPVKSGLWMRDPVNHLELMRLGDGRLMLVAARNNDRLQLFELTRETAGNEYQGGSKPSP